MPVPTQIKTPHFMPLFNYIKDIQRNCFRNGCDIIWWPTFPLPRRSIWWAAAKKVFGLGCKFCVQIQQHYLPLNTLRSWQDGCRFPDDIFKCILFNENVPILIKISLKFVLKVEINNIPALVQIMAWRQPGDKPLSGLVMLSLLTHVCVTVPQWVNVVCAWVN